MRMQLCSVSRFDLTWGPIEYHRRSLDNLQTAMKKSRKLCAIVLDTLGREVSVWRGGGGPAWHCVLCLWQQLI
jgi:pyruvate kinase